jgi:hypothetical protein
LPRPILQPAACTGGFEVGAVFANADMSRKPDGDICMMWTALRESDDLFMNAPMDEVTRHLCRERGDRNGLDVRDDRRTGYPGSFSFDPISIARPIQFVRHC